MAGTQPARVFVGAGQGEGTAQGKYRGGLFRCTSGDGRWEAVCAGLPENVEVRAIAHHPSNHDILFVGTQDGPYRSIDGGAHWERLDFPDRHAVIWTLGIHPTRPNIVYAGAAPVALYASEDGGDHWRRMPGAKSPAHCEREGFDTRTIRNIRSSARVRRKNAIAASNPPSPK